MRTRPHWFRCLLTVWAGVWLVAVSASGAIDLRMEEDRIWLEAEQVSLRDVLERFAHAGVRVQVDPALNARVSIRVADADLEDTLSEILDSFGYVFIWEVVDGPLGDWPRLAEIQVFRPGQPERMRPIQEPFEAFRVMPMPDGSGIEYIADEILIGFAAGSNPNAIRTLIREIGGTVVESLPHLGIYRIRLPPGSNVPALVEQLKQNTLVAGIEPNYAYRMPSPAPADTARPSRSAGTAARPPASGSAPVAVLDSGLNYLSDLEGFIAGGFNALQPDRPPTDTAGHGTQMALIAAGVVPPHGVSGQGEGVPVLPIRTFDDNGVTSNFAVMDSIAHASEQGAQVVNMSWGSYANSAFLDRAAQTAAQEDMVLVAAAGNEPVNRPMYPAAYDTVLAVAATAADYTPWPETNYGDFVTVAAPGTAHFPVGYQSDPGSYAGTSIASAYVSHALSHYRQIHPYATADDSVQALIRAVGDEQAGERTPYAGYGVLTDEALERLLRP